MKSPLESLFHSSPNYSKLRIFRYLCFLCLVPYVHNKLLPKSQPCVFLGYSSSQSAYLCYNFKSEKLYTSRHMYFVENIFFLILLLHLQPRLLSLQHAYNHLATYSQTTYKLFHTHISKFKFLLHCLLFTYHISKLIFTYIYANITA